MLDGLFPNIKKIEYSLDQDPEIFIQDIKDLADDLDEIVLIQFGETHFLVKPGDDMEDLYADFHRDVIRSKAYALYKDRQIKHLGQAQSLVYEYVRDIETIARKSPRDILLMINDIDQAFENFGDDLDLDINRIRRHLRFSGYKVSNAYIADFKPGALDSKDLIALSMADMAEETFSGFSREVMALIREELQKAPSKEKNYNQSHQHAYASNDETGTEVPAETQKGHKPPLVSSFQQPRP